jgi:hypothetical protein
MIYPGCAADGRPGLLYAGYWLGMSARHAVIKARVAAGRVREARIERARDG